MGVTRFLGKGMVTPMYRVTRAWAGQKEIQEYFHSYDEAMARDLELSRRQQAHKLRMQLPKNYLFGSHGKIRGLSRQTVRRMGRKPVEIFKLRFVAPGEQTVHYASISITAHGEQPAFAAVVAKLCEWLREPVDSAVAKLLYGAAHLYLGSAVVVERAKPVPVSEQGLAQLEENLRNDVQRHLDKMAQGVIISG